VRSIDEMAIRLDPSERPEPAARRLAANLKTAIRERAGEALTCSIGVATNEFLAKIASDMHKPDGLTFLPPGEVPQKLLGLELTDFPGISSNMERRLHERGITSVAEMYAADEARLRAVWGGVVGERWYHLIRGEEVALPATKRRTVGHSHVLAPKYRNEAGVRSVLLRLLQKAAARLRSLGYRARAMQVFVQGSGKEWGAAARFDAAEDELTLVEVFGRLWRSRDFAGPVAVGVTLHELIAEHEVTPSLFSAVNRRAALGKTLDAIHQKFGRNAVYIAAGHEALDTAEEKIAFLKTELFDEGAGENSALKAKAAALRALKREQRQRRRVPP
jgi:DNA polymerase-4